MATLTANEPREFELGERNHIPVIAADIIYEGAAVGIVEATGYAQPLTSSDRFGGFALRKADNSAGAAAAINVEVVKKGTVQIAVTGVVITDIGNPVYASDDNTFNMSPVSKVFVGFVKRFISTGLAVVEFDAGIYKDPYANYTVRETVSGNLNLDIQDNGKLLWVDTDAIVINLPAVATPVTCKIVNGKGFGAVLVSVSPNSADMIHMPNIAGTNDKDALNTKATARRGDFIVITPGDADGWAVAELRGTWAKEA